MRVTTKILSTGALMLLLVVGPSEVEAAAQCPAECRSEFNEVVCTSAVTRDADGRIIDLDFKFWTDGV